jgi:transposase InsO family protein
VGELLEATYHRFKRRYGAPRLAKELNESGVLCSRHYVAKLLRERALMALTGKGLRYVRATESNTRVEPNHLARNFTSDAPNRKWVSDISVPQQAAQEMRVWPLAIGLQKQVANHRKRLGSKAPVVSVAEKVPSGIR